MSRVAKLWKTLTEAEKAPYKEKSAQEFQAQRDALMRMGLDPRPRAGVGPRSRVDTSMVHMPLEATGKEAKKVKMFTIGPYTVTDKEGVPLLGSGS
eukprot:s3826_g2.t1